MALTTSEMSPADFAAMSGNNGFGNGDGWQTNLPTLNRGIKRGR